MPVSGSWAKSGIFATVLLSLLPFFLLILKGQTRCPKDYDSARCLCKGQLYDFPRVAGLLRIHARLHRLPCFFYLPRLHASRQPITSVDFNFVARQVIASVVIRAAKLKFVAESRTRVYFAQHVVSTCNTVFCCETSWSQTWSYAQQCVSTCDATMLRDKLMKNVARTTAPIISIQPKIWKLSKQRQMFTEISLKNFQKSKNC